MVNTGTLVDEFILSVAARVGWIQVEPTSVSVYPAADEPVAVVVSPPESPPAVAGPVPYRLLVRSSIHPHVNATVDGHAAVAPVDALTAEVAPVTVTSRGAVESRVLVSNDGNRPVLVELDRADRETGVDARVAPATLELGPGRSAEAVDATAAPPGDQEPSAQTETASSDARASPREGAPSDAIASRVRTRQPRRTASKKTKTISNACRLPCSGQPGIQLAHRARGRRSRAVVTDDGDSRSPAAAASMKEISRSISTDATSPDLATVRSASWRSCSSSSLCRGKTNDGRFLPFLPGLCVSLLPGPDVRVGGGRWSAHRLT